MNKIDDQKKTCANCYYFEEDSNGITICLYDFLTLRSKKLIKESDGCQNWRERKEGNNVNNFKSTQS